jgi:YebC/PmpR family DNA-binding regulatory protein
MGRQWLHAKRAVASLKKSKATGKFVKELTIAARQGGADAKLNARLAAAIEKARRESVSRDVIERAIQKGAGTGGEKDAMEHVTFEGYAPHKVPLIVEVVTDNNNRTAPEIRVLFRRGHLGPAGSNRFLFDQVGIVEGHRAEAGADIEAAAIEAGANDVEPLSHDQNDDIPPGALGARFITGRTEVKAVSDWLRANGWAVVTSEMGYIPKQYPELSESQRAEVGEFLQSLEEHDDVHRIWAAVR